MTRLLAGILCLFACFPAAAAELIADLKPNQDSQFAPLDISHLLSLGERAVFVAWERSSGHELWSSDGTPAGTELLLDLCSGDCSSSPALLGTLGGAALFAADPDGDGFGERQIWRTNGTRQGTTLVTGHGPQSCGSAESAPIPGAILFPGMDGGDCQIWRTDGTAAGTFPLGGILDGSDNPRLLTAAGGRVFFAAFTRDTGTALWRTDGTLAGTAPVRSFGADVFGMLATGPGVFLFLRGTSSELWRSDGTTAGTVRLAAFADRFAFDRFPGGPPQAVALGSRVIFRGPAEGATGQRLWTYSGSKAAPLSGCPGGCPPVLETSQLTLFGGRILFSAHGPDGSAELWSTDGTGAGTRRISTVCQNDCDHRPQRLLPFDGRAYFLAGSGNGFGLWRTDGTAAGTVRVAAQVRDPINRDLLAARAGSRIVFAGRDAVLGAQLWESDGTAAGTGPITAIDNTDIPSSTTASSRPAELVALGDRVVFRAKGEELSEHLWSSGGTAADTVRLVQVDQFEPQARTSVQAAGLVFFLKREENAQQLWRTDGTLAGTFRLTPEGIDPGPPVAFGGRAMFTASSETGDALWESDGTPGGTRELFELPPSSRGLVAVGPELWFVAELGASRIFRSDGTETGTREVTTTADGFLFRFPDPHPLEPVRAGAHVFFVARGRGLNALWRSDGTSAGTVPVLELGQSEGVDTTDLAELQGSLYLLAKHGLWKSDATAGSMVRLAEFVPFRRSAGPSFARLNGRLFFDAAGAEHGIELWRTDGTVEGTVLVRDISPGTAWSSPRDLTAAGGRLYFNAGDEEHGRELWESDGTEAGTRLVQDIAPGAHSSDPAELTAAGSRLFFRADDLLTGQEPWVHALAGGGCQAGAETLCLGNGRFRVEATWRDFQGNEGRGQAVALTNDTGYFWFFSPSNVEVVLKVLDGQGVNGHRWVFYGALSTVEYTLTVIDTQTGAARRYVNPPGRLASVGDTHAFGPLGAEAPAVIEYEPVIRKTKATAATCEPTATRLCLQGGRFAVEARWTDFQGNQGVGKAVSLSGDTGYFWFFDQANVEVVLKVLDGRGVNNRFWVFYGALSSVDYTLTVTDTQTGQVRTYHNAPGRLASVADTGAF